VMLGALCFVFYTLGAREFPGWSPLRFTALSATLGTVTVVAITEAATIAGWESTPSGHDLAAAGPALAYIVVFGAVIAVLAWNSAVQRLGAATAVLFNNLVPITAFAIAIAGGYAPNGYELGGAALTLAALAAVTTLNRAAAAPAPTPDRPRAPAAPRRLRAAAASAYARTRSR
jgi:drug/metabolite transporter (DMT)-like permease